MRLPKVLFVAALAASIALGCGARRRVYITVNNISTTFTTNVTNITTNTTNVTVQATGDPAPTVTVVPPGVTVIVPCTHDDPDEITVETHKGKVTYKKSDNYGGHLHVDADGKKHVDVNDD
jgi:hypothetical protein